MPPPPRPTTEPRASRFRLSTWSHLVLLEFGGLALDVGRSPDVQERLLRERVEVALDQVFERFNGFLNWDVDPFDTGEDLRHEHRLGEEALDLARSRHRDAVFFGKFIEAQDRDDVLQFLFALQDLLGLTSDGVVTVAHDLRRQDLDAANAAAANEKKREVT